MGTTARRAGVVVVLFATIACGSNSGNGDHDAAGGGDGGACVALDGACGAGGECCSGRCDGNRCVSATCVGQGLECTSPASCCSGMCGADSKCVANIDCKVFGSACTLGTDCCSGNCAATGGGACTGAGCTCAPSKGCKATGDPCSNDGQCCNNLCDRPGGAADGHCAEVGACRTAGEPCGSAGFNGSCCSTVCLDGDGEGLNRCQHLGGCRVQDDLCSNDAECCSAACRQDGQTLDGRPIKRCANAESCLPVGEVCGGQGGSSNCCPNGGGQTGCEPTGAGFRRCFGGTPGCTLPGDTCETTEQCCRESFPNIMCQDSPVASGKTCCLADGEICAFSDVCCGGICAPSSNPSDPPGTLRCGATCRPADSACTVDADCCDCCVNGACTASCGSCTGPQLGERCTPGGTACCNAPAVQCVGAEFPRCALASP